MDLNLLNYKIKTKGDTIKNLAEDLGLHYNTVTLKLNGKLQFTQSEIKFLAKRYELTPEEITVIFF
jgi:plasmid maintenance system antidote protein VapI